MEKKKALKTELIYDPAIPLKCIHPENTTVQKDTRCYVHCSAVHNGRDMEAT